MNNICGPMGFMILVISYLELFFHAILFVYKCLGIIISIYKFYSIIGHFLKMILKIIMKKTAYL